MNPKPIDVDGYLATVSADARRNLEQLRRTIATLVPAAVEGFTYGMPGFKYRDRPLIYFAAWRGHCALYGLDVEAHRDELSAFDLAKGTIRFPVAEPFPVALLKRLIDARIAVIDQSAASRRRKKLAP